MAGIGGMAQGAW
jgi:cold shock protein